MSLYPNPQPIEPPLLNPKYYCGKFPYHERFQNSLQNFHKWLHSGGDFHHNAIFFVAESLTGNTWEIHLIFSQDNLLCMYHNTMYAKMPQPQAFSLLIVECLHYLILL